MAARQWSIRPFELGSVSRFRRSAELFTGVPWANPWYWWLSHPGTPIASASPPSVITLIV